MEKGKKKSNLMVFILIALASALSVFSIQTFLHNRSLIGEIKSINEKLESLHLISTSKDALGVNREVLNLQFKEDFYLNQLNNSTTIILGSIGFVLALGGFLTFKSIDERLILMEQKAKAKSDEISKLLYSTIEGFNESSEIVMSEILDFKSKLKEVERTFRITDEQFLEDRIKTEKLCEKILSEGFSYSQAIKHHVLTVNLFSRMENSKDFGHEVFNKTMYLINSYLSLYSIELRNKKTDGESKYDSLHLKSLVEKIIFQIESVYENEDELFSTYSFSIHHLDRTRELYEELSNYRNFDYLEKLIEALEDKMKFNEL